MVNGKVQVFLNGKFCWFGMGLFVVVGLGGGFFMPPPFFFLF